MSNLRAEVGRSGGPWTFHLTPDADFGPFDLATSGVAWDVYPKGDTTAVYSLTDASSEMTVTASENSILIRVPAASIATIGAGKFRYVLTVTTSDGHKPQLDGGGSGSLVITDVRL